jgi:hypothetical protein
MEGTGNGRALKLLLDTHPLVWFLIDRKRIPERLMAVLIDPANPLRSRARDNHDRENGNKENGHNHDEGDDSADCFPSVHELLHFVIHRGHVSWYRLIKRSMSYVRKRSEVGRIPALREDAVRALAHLRITVVYHI